MIKLKTLLSEQSNKGIPQDKWDASPGHSNQSYNPPRGENVSIKVKQVGIDFKYNHQTAYYDEELDSSFIDQLVGDIQQQIEDSKVYGVYSGTNDLIDVNRVVSNLQFDCEAIFERLGQPKIEIDFKFDMDLDNPNQLEHFQIEDELPSELGITEDEFADMVSNRINGGNQ